MSKSSNVRVINLNHTANILANQIEIIMNTLKNHKNYKFSGVNGMLNDLGVVIDLMKRHANITSEITSIKYPSYKGSY